MISKKRLISAVLTFSLVFTGCVGETGLLNTAYAANHDTYLTGEYKEGSVIVCVKENTDETKGRSALNALFEDIGGGEAKELLEGAEELMDVTCAAEDAAGNESLLFSDEVSDGRQNALFAGDWENVSLKLVSSEKYGTGELMDMLDSRPEVLFTEPDYIIPAAEETVEEATAEGELPICAGALEEGSSRDLTPYQYSFGNGPGGVDIPGWNDPSNLNAKDLVIAVVDTGIDYENEDLKDVMWDKGLEYDSLKKLGGGMYGINTSGEALGTIDDPIDKYGHGTHCAGMIAASWNGKGISGAVNGAKLMAVKTIRDNGWTLYSSDLKGLDYVLEAKRAGVNVAAANCSWGGATFQRSIALAAKELEHEGVVTVFSSGNLNTNTDYEESMAGYLSAVPGVINVNSNDKTGRKLYSSNFGVRSTEIFAPGKSVLSTYIEDILISDLIEPGKDMSDRVMKSDFESDGYFLIGDKADKLEVSRSYEEDPMKAGNHAMKAAFCFPRGNKKETYSLFDITPPLNAGIPYEYRKLSFAMSVRSEADDITVRVYAKDKSNQYQSIGAAVIGKEMERLACEIPESTDISDLTLKVTVCSDTEQPSDSEARIWFDDLFLSTDDGYAPCGYLSGTSMAAPCIAGEAAILAAKFPGDSAAKRAARILGSAALSEDLKGLCVTGGIANVRNALNEDYMPVVNGISEDPEGKLLISGYFFGDNPGVKLLQNGTEFTPEVTKKGYSEDIKDQEVLLVERPEGLETGEMEVSVINSGQNGGRQTGSRYLSLELSDAPGSYYERIKLPEDEVYSTAIITAAAGVNGTVYLAGYNESSYEPVSFALRDGKLEAMEKPLDVWQSSNLCAFDKKLLYFGRDKRFYSYDPVTGKTEGFDLSTGSDFSPEDFTELYYTGEELLIFNTKNDTPTEVWKLDPLSLRTEKLLQLGAIYAGGGIYGLKNTEKGREVYILLGCVEPKSARSAAEKITIDGSTGKVSREFVSKNIIPEGFIFPMDPCRGYGTEKGIYITGGYKKKAGSDSLETDNWYFDFASSKPSLQPAKKMMSGGLSYYSSVVSYGGKVYFTGKGLVGKRDCFIAFTEEATKDPGDVSLIPEAKPDIKIVSLETASDKSVSLKKGGRATLFCKAVYPEGMKEEERPPLLYSAGNDRIAAVNPLSGELTARALGSTIVTASCGDKSVSFDINVTDKAVPYLEYKQLSIKEGEIQKIKFEPGYVTGKEKVIWTSLDKKTATVKNGLVTGNKAGTTLIRITVKEGKDILFQDEIYLTVKGVDKPVNVTKDKNVKLKLGAGTIKTSMGDKVKLKAVLSGTGKDTAEATFNVSNTDIMEAAETPPEKKTEGNNVTYEQTFSADGPGTVWISVSTKDPSSGAENVRVCKVIISSPAKELALSLSDIGRVEEDVYILKKGSYGEIVATPDKNPCTDTLSFKAKGGAVTVNNGIVYAKKVSKIDKKTGKPVPDTVTVKCGKVTRTVKVAVE